MNKIIPSVIEDNGEYYIHMEEYKKVKELGDHYKHLYSEVKKQKDDGIKYIKSKKAIINTDYIRIFDLFEIDEQGYTEELLRMLGEEK
jgi:hypothetical protein